MGKRQQKELRRLEEALLEADYSQESFGHRQPAGNTAHDIYNTDDADVDLEEYSQDVYREESGRGLGVVITMLAMLLLASGILLFLKFMGVL